MPELQRLPHLRIDNFFTPRPYNYPTDVKVTFKLAQRNRDTHGNLLLQQLNQIKDHFEISQEEELSQNILRDDVVYVEFYSEYSFDLKFDSLSQENSTSPKYQLLSIKKETYVINGDEQSRYRVVVMMKEGGITKFIQKVTQYLTEFSNDKEGNPTDKPRNQALLNNIATIQLATLQSFWTDEPEIPFPENEASLWWEVWFRKTDNDQARLNRVLNNLQEIGAQVGEQTLQFPEHVVMLIRASANQLSSSLVLLDNLAELRKPQEINNFVTDRNVDYNEKQEWINDLLNRTDISVEDNSVIICLLDSGVNNKHPLLNRILLDDRLYTYKESWGTNDTWPMGGHGTSMAGLAIYGDLVEALATTERIRILHGLESFKIIHPADPSEPSIYGAVIEYATSLPIIDHPNNRRIYCMAITDESLAFKGRPSSWSAAIDKIVFGNVFEPQTPQLFILSSGNVDYLNSGVDASHYPDRNYLSSIHDPSQSYNAVAVGSYTRMDRIDQTVWNGVTALAPNGGMSPSNSTSLLWENPWPVKPDIVMEGGNLGVDNLLLRDDVHSLKPLSIDKDFLNYIFYPFGDTSGAAALASKMAAEIMAKNPALWPETIRGLMIHSAEWTDRMLNNISLATAPVAVKRELLRTFGYGVPILHKALESANNALTLIAETEIQPYRIEGSTVKYNEYHLYSIPWPVDILRDVLTDEDVILKVTLSYFIEPNPGNKRYANSYHYQSHTLDFKTIKPTEDEAAFRRRISAAVEGNDEQLEYDGASEPWSLKESVRSRGSIKKDFIFSSGADLSTRNLLAIYPKGGWYRSRKKLKKYNSKVRYSLIISLETERTEIDIYTPVFNQIPVELNSI